MSFPEGRELAGVCRAGIRAWHRHPPPLEWATVCASFGGAADGWSGLVGELCLINHFQWHLEDECRAHYADAHRLAALKREIDASNARRVHAIDVLDERLARELPPADGNGARVALISPGNQLDRISILELKRGHAAERDGVVAILDEQIADACSGLDWLVEDLLAARQCLRHYGTVKLYRAP